MFFVLPLNLILQQILFLEEILRLLLAIKSNLFIKSWIKVFTSDKVKLSVHIITVLASLSQ